MRDLVLYAHIILGVALIVFPIIILQSKKWRRPLSIITAAISWLLLLPSGILYLIFYPATKSLVKAGSWPWAHLVVMETKEHWGLLIPIVATVAAGLVLSGKFKESRKWWWLVIILAVVLGFAGRIIKMGALA